MSASDRFKPYDPNVQAVVRLEEALPPEHPTHVFVDLVQGNYSPTRDGHDAPLEGNMR